MTLIFCYNVACQISCQSLLRRALSLFCYDYVCLMYQRFGGRQRTGPNREIVLFRVFVKSMREIWLWYDIAVWNVVFVGVNVCVPGPCFCFVLVCFVCVCGCCIFVCTCFWFVVLAVCFGVEFNRCFLNVFVYVNFPFCCVCYVVG